jgi:flavin-dependent dehydrogenase
VGGVPLGLGPRRSQLDAVLVEAATAAGAELREGFLVREPLWEDGRVVGIRGGGIRSGAAETARAAVVVGADGRNSGLAKGVGAPVQEGVPTLSCWYFSYWSGVAWPIAELPAVRADPEAALLAVVARAPGLMERLAAGRREERVRGAAQLPNFLRRPFGPGWALVGDSGCHKDPYMALGVCDALRDASS